jgi:hypothetical protein
VGTPAASTNQPANSSELPETAGQQRYKVVAGTTYFFDSAEPTAKPTGKYLLRGDVLYGDVQRNGFVRTRFKLPSGATATGWLKQEELGLLAGTSVAPQSRQPARAQTVAEAPEPAEYSYEQEPTAPSVGQAESSSSIASQAVVQVARSYFYDSPDLLQPRKAHCVQGDKVRLGEVQGEAVYVTFTNWQKVTSKGWMRRDALRPIL